MNAPAPRPWTVPLFLALAAAAAARGDAPAPGTDAAGDPLPAGALARLGTARFRGQFFTGLALSPDGKQVAFTETRGSVRLVDTATGKTLRMLNTLIPVQSPLIFSPTGDLLASGTGVGRPVRVVSATDGHTVREFGVDMPGRPFGIFFFSGDGKYLAVLSHPGADQGKAYVWEVPTGKLFGPLELIHNNLSGGTLSHDGKLLATWGWYNARGPQGPDDAERSRTVQLWDVAAGKELRKLKPGQYNVVRAAFTPDGKTLAVATGGSLVELYDVATGRRLYTLAGRRGTGAWLTFSPDGKTLAASAGGWGSAVQLWDAVSGRRLGVGEGPPGQLTGLAFTGPGRAVALSRSPEALFLWEVPSGKVLSPRAGHDAGVVSVSYARDGRSLLSAGHDGSLLRWDARGRPAGRLALQESDDERRMGIYRQRSVFLPSPDGAYALVGSEHMGGLTLYELAGGREVCTFPADGRFSPFDNRPPGAYSPDGALLAMALQARRPNEVAALSVWETASGRELYNLTPATGAPLCLAFAPDGKTLAVATGDSQAAMRRMNGASCDIVLYDLATGKAARTLRAMGRAPTAMIYSPDGRRVALARQGGISVRDAATGSEVHALPLQGTVSVGPVFSPDGRTLAAGLMENRNPGEFQINLWEMATGKLRHSFAGHRGTINGLAFAPDGRTLASGSADTTVLLWDTTGRALFSRGKPAPVPEKLWAALASDDPAAAWEAMAGLASAPEEGVAWLRDHLRPAAAKGVDPAEVARLVADLDSDRFDDREEAARGLGELGA
jgi:WD40 repeat protein